MNISDREVNSYRDQSKMNAQHLIEQIKLKEKFCDYELVLDIGSGFGNMSMLLADKINCKNLIGLDIDDQMVEFARHYNKRDNVNYLQCDVQLPWDQLSDEVKQLEGRCSIIFSNTVFHWITNVNRCAENLSRFLAPGGRLYAATMPIDDLYRLEGPAKQLESAILLLKRGNFTQTWQSALIDRGLRVKSAKEVVRNCIIPQRFVEKFVVPMSYGILLQHATTNKALRLVNKHKFWLAENVYDKMTIDKPNHYRFDLKSLFIVAKK